MVTTDLNHLAPDLRTVAAEDDAQRIAFIRGQWWIGYPHAQAALDLLRTAIENEPGRVRPQCFLLLGPTNNGKSMIVEKFRRDHTPAALPGRDEEDIPVVVVQMLTDPGVARFYQHLLEVLGAPVRRTARKHDLEAQALSILKRVGTKVLIIDELHNILAGTSPAQREFLNLLRFLGNELRIPVVGAGTRDAYLAIRTDPQLENRFHPIILPVWEEGDELSRLIQSFVATFPLRKPSFLNSADLQRWVLARTGGTIGEIAALLRSAAVAAVESGEEAINQRSLQLMKYYGPAERRRLTEKLLT
ncbi:TniB family NTP-binding protein [Chelativorans sp. AA-79]|uniref:TniB family NTP-binding protein n=1 Tax=Chelativorans sp. AA-79 TaxID=3028735 RepID=UPI0023F8AE26|nr:TniB family NTP-binding protein [Chelativorans sp. AA-79]WEX12207.1 TniB family NTP-binding protein [Chelativorans sp. AA-79]WEX12318.1 TniB family NTP-binding protein [Chelativorans sp. AA-79]